MRRFHWPLQRLLDVTAQRERAQRAEMLSLSRQLAQLRRRVMVNDSAVRGLIAEAGRLDLAERLRRHDATAAAVDAYRRRIRRLTERLDSLEARRREQSRLLMQTRKKRQTLERLREEARQEHLREQLKIEQKQFDES
ncbi:MAG: hypothetical protein J7M21_03685, partial [Planctomycetes bacterium]|nr:hypothetical protein [Planctomycetota bacterium]